jgi:predicted RNA-binding protein
LPFCQVKITERATFRQLKGAQLLGMKRRRGGQNMLIYNAYVDRNGKMELLSEEVASIEIEKGNVLLKEFFGEQKVIQAHSKEIDFLNGKIILEKS